MMTKLQWVLFVVMLTAALSSTSGSDCVSGIFDAITRTSDGNTYAFKDNMVVQLNDAGNGIFCGYPQHICNVFPGLPSDLDAAVNWRNGKTYFFKGDKYWRTSGTSLDNGYPVQISVGWPGLPNDIDAGVVWARNGKGYFFKGTQYWRYDPNADKTDAGPLDTNTHWSGYNQSTVDSAVQWSNGKMYLFKGEQYWRWNDEEDRAEPGYPLYTTSHWLGCPTDGPTVAMADTVCYSGIFDAITTTSDGKTYAFKDASVLQLIDAGSDFTSGYPKLISEVFPGLPSHLDAAVHWHNEKTYFFKGDKYWRTSGTSLDNGYPVQISVGWPGLPNDIDAGVVWARNGKGYFLKGTQYWRYDPITDRTEAGPLDTYTHWSGYNQSTVDAAFQWSNGKMYLFKGEQYWRWNDEEDRAESGYPLYTTRHWLGCPTNGPIIELSSTC